MRTARYRSHWAAAALAAVPAILCAPARAEETAALRVLRQLQTLQTEHSHLAPELLPPLLELGQLWAHGQCDRAIDILELALDVSRANDGLFDTRQLAIYEPLLNCYDTLDRPAEFQRAQHYVILIHETSVGPNDPRLLPALDEAARRSEHIGLYLSARRLYRRAIDIVERTSGPDDLRLVTPLRGMARAFRLEYAYGLAPADVAELSTEFSGFRSKASIQQDWGTRLDPLGQRSLERAAAILRSHAGPDEEGAARTERIETLLELGDWHQLADNARIALRLYREAWHEFAAAGPQPILNTEPHHLFETATLLRVSPATGTPLRRTPPERPDRIKYTIDLEFTVTRHGRVDAITVLESNAPQHIDQEAIDDLRRFRFRPRFENGEPIDTPGLHHRANIHAKRPVRDVQAAR